MKRLELRDLPVLLTVVEAGQQLRLSRSRVYELIRDGKLRSVKVGGARRVPAAAVDAYVRTLR